MRAKLTQSTRAGLALLALAAIITQLTRHVGYNYSVVNFFSYFTNLSNLFFAAVLLTAAIVTLIGQKPSHLFEIVRGAAVLCMVIVGIVFSLLLRKEDLGTLLPWVNIVLHYVMPVVAIVDWLLVPPSLKFTRKHILAWLIFPLIYVTYSLARGAINDWYAYPFFNPTKVGGYAGVSLYCIGICILFLLAGWAVATLPKKLKNTKPAR